MRFGPKLQTVRLGELPDLTIMRVFAAMEGFHQIDRLADEWATGACRFEKSGEALFAVFFERELAGVGGVTREPSDPEGDVLRVRRVYVAPQFRDLGAGRALVGAIVAEGFQNASTLNVNSKSAGGFWEKMGFTAVDAPSVTHRIQR